MNRPPLADRIRAYGPWYLVPRADRMGRDGWAEGVRDRLAPLARAARDARKLLPPTKGTAR